MNMHGTSPAAGKGLAAVLPSPGVASATGAALERRSVLLVEDEPGIRAALTAHFGREGWRVTATGGLREAEYRLAQDGFDLVVSDVRLPDGSGVELLRATAGTPVVLLTAFGTVPDAVQAIQHGASDYLAKPVAWAELRALAERLTAGVPQDTRFDDVDAIHQPAPSTPWSALPDCAGDAEQERSQSGIVGSAPALLAALSRARAAARTDADVLVEAESGTGKELIARYIHDASDRAQKPFVAINCAAVPEHLLESELFGHARGAFTGATQAKPGKFELASGGTLLLDEIGEMPLHLQPKLLRALQEREFERLGETRTIRVDIRVIATTNVRLADAVDRGLFRSDLYYRLNVIPLTLPSLAERVADIPRLAAFFARSWAERAGQPLPAMTPDFLALLEAEPWPGNIRELSNFLRRVFSLQPAGAPLTAESFLRERGCTQAARVRVGDRPAPLASAHRAQPVHFPSAMADAAQAPSVPPVSVPIRQLERLHLENTLQLTRGNRTHAAEMLGISLRTMRNKIREYGLPPRRYA